MEQFFVSISLAQKLSCLSKVQVDEKNTDYVDGNASSDLVMMQHILLRYGFEEINFSSEVMLNTFTDV